MLGTTVGHYRVEAEIGAGGMGVVYRARDLMLNRDVALKIVSPGAGGHQTARERLLREARAASALNHPNVCTIHEVEDVGGQSFIVMELVSGRPLSATIPPGGLPADRLLGYGRQVADALAHAHERRILHRDLKSANIVVTPDGRVKVLDFGLASQLDRDALDDATRSRVSVTEGGAIAGTLSHLAPEVLSGEAPGVASDLWAFGVLLHEMATGTLPFRGRSGFEITAAILREPLAPLPTTVPPGLRAVIARCLKKDPGQRYQGAREVRAALETIDSATTTVADRSPTSARRATRATLWTLAALAIVAAAVWIGRTTLSPGPVGPAAPASSAPGARSSNAEANEYYERAQLFLRQQLDLPRARQMLERALQLDPSFALARADYGFTHLALVDSGESNDSQWLYKAEDELRRAARDGPTLTRPHSALAAVYLYQGRKELMPAELELARLGNEPEDPDIDNWQLNYEVLSGNGEAAEALARRLIQRNPVFFPARMNLGEILRMRGDLAGAIREQEKILEQDPKNVYAIEKLARVYIQAGDRPAARRALDRTGPADLQNYEVRLCWALLLAVEGDRASALTALDAEVLKFAEISPLSTARVAEVYALVGEIDRALDWLDRAVRLGDERLDWYRRNPLLQGLRDHPRFSQILGVIAARRAQRRPPPPR